MGEAATVDARERALEPPRDGTGESGTPPRSLPGGGGGDRVGVGEPIRGSIRSGEDGVAGGEPLVGLARPDSPTEPRLADGGTEGGREYGGAKSAAGWRVSL